MENNQLEREQIHEVPKVFVPELASVCQSIIEYHKHCVRALEKVEPTCVALTAFKHSHQSGRKVGVDFFKSLFTILQGLRKTAYDTKFPRDQQCIDATFDVLRCYTVDLIDCFASFSQNVDEMSAALQKWAPKTNYSKLLIEPMQLVFSMRVLLGCMTLQQDEMRDEDAQIVRKSLNSISKLITQRPWLIFEQYLIHTALGRAKGERFQSKTRSFVMTGFFYSCVKPSFKTVLQRKRSKRPHLFVLLNDLLLWVSSKTTQKVKGYVYLTNRCRIVVKGAHSLELNSGKHSYIFEFMSKPMRDIAAYAISKSIENLCRTRNDRTLRIRDIEQSLSIVAKIGNGASASIYKAIMLPAGRVVAAKVIPSTYDPQLKRELFVLRRCRHPNIVKFLGIGGPDSKGRSWLLEEFCHGTTAQLPSKHLTEIQIAYIIYRVLEALSYLHDSLQVIHRDIKASNILLTVEGEIRLADFGISKAIGLDYTIGQACLGTPHWMSPEAFTKSQPLSFAADIWSIGITTLQLLNDRVPRENLSPFQLALVIERDEPPWEEIPTSSSEELRSFIISCLAKDPTKRPTAKSLLKSEIFAGVRKLRVNPLCSLLSYLKHDKPESVDQKTTESSYSKWAPVSMVDLNAEEIAVDGWWSRATPSERGESDYDSYAGTLMSGDEVSFDEPSETDSATSSHESRRSPSRKCD